MKLFQLVSIEAKSYLCTEFVTGGDLVNLIAAFGLMKKEMHPIFQQVVPIVEYLHKRNISHWDIKVKNILIDVAEIHNYVILG